jgi:hypothetical protein
MLTIHHTHHTSYSPYIILTIHHTHHTSYSQVYIEQLEVENEEIAAAEEETKERAGLRLQKAEEIIADLRREVENLTKEQGGSRQAESAVMESTSAYHTSVSRPKTGSPETRHADRGADSTRPYHRQEERIAASRTSSRAAASPTKSPRRNPPIQYPGSSREQTNDELDLDPPADTMAYISSLRGNTSPAKPAPPPPASSSSSGVLGPGQEKEAGPPDLHNMTLAGRVYE